MSNLFRYFGIQNKNNDYYFKEEWEQWEKEGKIKLSIAESRPSEGEKKYVQHKLEEDVEFL